MKTSVIVRLFFQCAALGVALNGSLLSQERLEVIKDEVRKQYKAGKPKTEVRVVTNHLVT